MDKASYRVACPQLKREFYSPLSVNTLHLLKFKPQNPNFSIKDHMAASGPKLNSMGQNSSQWAQISEGLISSLMRLIRSGRADFRLQKPDFRPQQAEFGLWAGGGRGMYKWTDRQMTGHIEIHSCILQVIFSFEATAQ